MRSIYQNFRLRNVDFVEANFLLFACISWPQPGAFKLNQTEDDRVLSAAALVVCLKLGVITGLISMWLKLCTQFLDTTIKKKIWQINTRNSEAIPVFNMQLLVTTNTRFKYLAVEAKKQLCGSDKRHNRNGWIKTRGPEAQYLMSPIT